MSEQRYTLAQGTSADDFSGVADSREHQQLFVHEAVDRLNATATLQARVVELEAERDEWKRAAELSQAVGAGDADIVAGADKRIAELEAALRNIVVCWAPVLPYVDTVEDEDAEGAEALFTEQIKAARRLLEPPHV